MTLATGSIYAGLSVDPKDIWRQNRLRLREAESSQKSVVLSCFLETAGWLDHTISRIRDLRWLDAGWDGPDSFAIDPMVMDTAHHLVLYIADNLPRLPPPTVTPTPSSGIFIEWYRPDNCIAFTVLNDGQVELCYEDAVAGDDWECPITDLTPEDWLRVFATYRN